MSGPVLKELMAFPPQIETRQQQRPVSSVPEDAQRRMEITDICTATPPLQLRQISMQHHENKIRLELIAAKYAGNIPQTPCVVVRRFPVLRWLADAYGQGLRVQYGKPRRRQMGRIQNSKNIAISSIKDV